MYPQQQQQQQQQPLQMQSQPSYYQQPGLEQQPYGQMTTRDSQFMQQRPQLQKQPSLPLLLRSILQGEIESSLLLYNPEALRE
jgi:hypothetical protein